MTIKARAKKKTETSCPLYLKSKKEIKYDYDMVMVYCPRCNAKFVDVVRPYMWQEGNKNNQIFICLFCGAKLFLW